MTSEKKSIKLSALVSPAFWKVHQQVKEGAVQEVVLKGGEAVQKQLCSH